MGFRLVLKSVTLNVPVGVMAIILCYDTLKKEKIKFLTNL